MENIKKYIAECIGTMFLVLMGCGSAMIAGPEVGNLGIAFSFGLTVMVMVYAIGPLTGCHINPAITIAMWANGKMKGEEAFGYIVAQFVGAVMGAILLFAILSGGAAYNPLIDGLGQNGFGLASPAGYGVWAAIIAEFILTALFLFVICGATAPKALAGFAGIVIGLCLTLIHIVGIPVTGVSVNPARSFGPAFILCMGGNCVAMSQIWLFLIVPVLGGLFGAWLYKTVTK
ncbi:MAG: aquaporin [Elusimicrobiota bacterium]|jgi:aquaporin Z|nr:aquaporin [Elusimicrobiota bacterium]